VDRRRLRTKFTGLTQRAVRQKITHTLKESQTGGVVPIQKDSLATFLRTWLNTLRAKGRKETTIANYEWMIEKHVALEIGNIPLTRLSQRDLNSFMQGKLDTGLSAASVRTIHAVLRSALSKAEKDGLVGRNVAKLAEPPPGDQSKVEPLTPEQARAFLLSVAGHRLEALYSVAIAIGLRRGEALALGWSDVDFGAKTVSVRRTLQRVRRRRTDVEKGERKSRLKMTDPKSQKSAPLVPLPSFAIESLKRHRERQEGERVFAGDHWKENGLMFTTTIGTPVEPRNVLRQFQALLADVNIPPHRFHDLRHTAASLLLAQGATLS
jgi:integrase